jgi:nitroreductase
MERRSFLRGAGAVLVVVSGGVVWRAYDTGVIAAGRGPAFEPWDDWRRDSGGRPLALVRAAILAANPFNTQPWLFRVGESAIEIYADNTRNTGKFDPFLRELRIGLGCAIENLMLAAPANGYRTALTVAPGALVPARERPDRERVAGIELEDGAREESELYRAIPKRHTNRYPYDSRVEVSEGFVASLQHLADDEQAVMIRGYTDDAMRAEFVDICTKAVLEDARNADARSGVGRWARDWKSLQRLHDGNSLDDGGQGSLAVAASKFFPASVLALLQTRHPPDLVTAIKQGYTSRLETARLFGFIAVRDLYDQPQAVTAGRIWQRAHLLATARGLAARPVNQPVQLVDHQRVQGALPKGSEVLERLTGDKTWVPTFMFMMGYPTRPAHPTARRGVTDVLL